MNLNRAFSRLGLSIVMLTLVGLGLPTRASAALIDYRAVITAQDSSGTTLGYLADDGSYWTPLLTATSSGALIVGFTLPNGTTGTQINLTQNDARGPLFGLVVDETARVRILQRAASTTYISIPFLIPAHPRCNTAERPEFLFDIHGS